MRLFPAGALQASSHPSQEQISPDSPSSSSDGARSSFSASLRGLQVGEPLSPHAFSGDESSPSSPVLSEQEMSPRQQVKPAEALVVVQPLQSDGGAMGAENVARPVTCGRIHIVFFIIILTAFTI